MNHELRRQPHWYQKWNQFESKQVGSSGKAIEFDPKASDPATLKKYLDDMRANAGRKADDIVRWVKPGDVVLDMGAGEGEVSALIAKTVPDAKVIALDYSSNVVSNYLTCSINERHKTHDFWFCIKMPSIPGCRATVLMWLSARANCTNCYPTQTWGLEPITLSAHLRRWVPGPSY